MAHIVTATALAPIRLPAARRPVVLAVCQLHCVGPALSCCDVAELTGIVLALHDHCATSACDQHNKAQLTDLCDESPLQADDELMLKESHGNRISVSAAETEGATPPHEMYLLGRLLDASSG